MNFVVVYNSVIFSLSKYFVPKDYSNYFTGEKTEANTGEKKQKKQKVAKRRMQLQLMGKRVLLLTGLNLIQSGQRNFRRFQKDQHHIITGAQFVG